MVLDLVRVVAEKTDALKLLEEAYDARLQVEGEGGVVLDSILESARSKGFYGSSELAAGVLRVSGRFQLQKRAAGKWHAVRQSAPTSFPVGPLRPTALVPIDPARPSRTLVPVEIYQQTNLELVDAGHETLSGFDYYTVPFAGRCLGPAFGEIRAAG